MWGGRSRKRANKHADIHVMVMVLSWNLFRPHVEIKSNDVTSDSKPLVVCFESMFDLIPS